MTEMLELSEIAAHAFMLNLADSVVWCAYDGWAVYVPFEESYSSVELTAAGYERQIAAMQGAWLVHLAEDETGVSIGIT